MSHLSIGDCDSGVYKGSSKTLDDGVDAMGERLAVGREEENALVGFAGYFAKVWKWFKELCKIGPPLGYFPEPDRYLGGYIGEGTDNYVADKVKDWVESVKCFLPMVKRNSQAVNTAFSCSLHHQWSFLQCVIAINPTAYKQFDHVFQEELIPALLDMDVVDDTLLPLFSLPIKYTGIGALTPTHKLPLNRATFTNITAYLKGAIK
eukprot:15354671-Ditylum_brightwellii.AAC.2